MILRQLLYLHQLRRNLYLDSSSLQRLQLKKLKSIIQYAYENVPFYHKKFRAANISPADIGALSDLSKIPVTAKSEIQSNSLQDMISKKYDPRNCVFRSTSGSTGQPLTVALSKKELDFESAVWSRTFSTNGLGLKDKMTIISDPRSFSSNKFAENFGILKRQYISIFDTAQTKLKLLEQFKPNAIKAYPTSLAILAHSKPTITSKPRLIFTAAETLDKQSRNLIHSVFQVNPLDNYACTEFGLIAWECLEHVGYHMNVSNVLVEFVKDGESVASQERGEILCTGLYNEAMPLIRYQMSDVGVPIQEKCSCGRTLPLMKIIEGRKDDFLVTTRGQVISPTIFFPYPFKSFEGIKQFKVIQEKKDKIVIQLASEKGFVISDQHLKRAISNIWQLFGDDMNVEFQMVQKIERDPSGKLRKIVSKIPAIEKSWNHADIYKYLEPIDTT